MIEADSLVKRYGPFEAVKGVSFRVEKGQVIGLLGPNGAGKTSIMRILTCYHFPTTGTARVNEHDVITHPHLVRQAVGYLPENAPLYDDMKVREYLSFIADVRGLSGARRAQRIGLVVDSCGLAEVFSREIRHLSKGYRQRVGLAQAILHDPAVLVMDEPTSGLDPNQIVEIRALIRDLGREKTVILSTHILQEVEALCRRVLIMNAGRLIAQGTPEEIARGMQEGMVLSVSLKGSLEDSEARSLESLEGVRAVGAVRRLPEGRVEVDLDVAPGMDPSEAVYDWAVAHGCKILGMRTEKTRLEDLFARLTGGGRDA
ncbi:MAG: ATP-binding cassette domain-containing protein [Spirochaetia bacterium]|jgi:ABC-2 type transport system ATP-binding protein